MFVPDRLSPSDAKLLATKMALARILATSDNPDAPEDDAFSDYANECSDHAGKTADKTGTAATIKASVAAGQPQHKDNAMCNFDTGSGTVAYETFGKAMGNEPFTMSLTEKRNQSRDRGGQRRNRLPS